MNYYEFLIGFDLSVFPSYYEPWGYTPMESLAFAIPTVTTTLSGFGLWVKFNVNEVSDAVYIIERTDNNHNETVEQIANAIIDYNKKPAKEKQHICKKATEISKLVLWDKLIDYYIEAYSIALQKVEARASLFENKIASEHIAYPLTEYEEQPIWHTLPVQSNIPKQLEKLKEIAFNLWWSWNYEAINLFKSIDEKLWNQCGQNPILLLDELTYEQLLNLENKPQFINTLNEVYTKFKNYIKAGENNKAKDQIAYFSMEYGLHDSLTTFSGGLGILAGDHLKQASDSNFNLIGIGILYRYGYFTQAISVMGDQISKYKRQRFSKLPITLVRNSKGESIKIGLAFPGRIVYARVWRVDVGRIPLYLLDTDFEYNNEEDRAITYQLYGGDKEYRLKQEILLGIGGIRLIEELGLTPTIYHCNEGHAAFINLERLRHYIQNEKLEFRVAKELVRASSLFTSHTPVPAGHDTFKEDLIRIYMSHFPSQLNISWNDFINLGKFNENDQREDFSMSVLAARLSQEMNGVSKLHGEVTQKMFNGLYKGYFPEESYISYVTNGVHYKTWAAEEWQKLIASEIGEEIFDDQTNPELWEKVKYLSDRSVWNIRKTLKKKLIAYVKNRIQIDMTNRQENPQLIFETLEAINEEAFIIGFARRFATYKRAFMLFQNLERLERIVNMEGMPVIFLFAGKAHPNDKAGQELIQRIIQITKEPAFIGKVIFIENYNMEVASFMVQGCDIWLNTPTRLMEASGTSGMKAGINGTINLSVLDGWWYEGYKPDAGWAITEKQTYENTDMQDKLDAETIYNILEDEIIPLYFQEDSVDINPDWITYIKNSIYEVGLNFNMKRQVMDYKNKFYDKLIERTKFLKKDHYKEAHAIADWKQYIKSRWDKIEIVSEKLPNTENIQLKVTDSINVEVVLNLHRIPVSDIAVNLVLLRSEDDDRPVFLNTYELSVINSKGSVVTYGCNIPMEKAGIYKYAIRIIPKTNRLPHQQDIEIVRWI